MELVGWGVGKESWGIRYQKIYGDPLKPQIWEDLDRFLQTRWRREDGVVLDILAAAMDTGGHHTDAVYRFCLDRFYRHVYAIKGRGGTETPFVSKPSTGNRVGVPLYTIGVDNGKTMVYQRLNVQAEGPNYCHFPLNEAAGYDEVYFKGLTAEKQVIRWKKGRPSTAWELKDPNYHRNEPLDCRDYALAALEIANPALENPEEETEMQTPQRQAWPQNRIGKVSGKWQVSQKSRRKPSCQTWMEAEEKIASGQGYSIGDRRLTRADLYTVRGEIEYWNNKVKELEAAEQSGRNRMYRFVIRDI